MTVEDKALLERIHAEETANRAYNQQRMDEAGVPDAARRGFARATGYGSQRIDEITEYPRDGKASRWGLFVELYPGSSTRMCWLIGPRGRAKKVA